MTPRRRVVWTGDTGEGATMMDPAVPGGGAGDGEVGESVRRGGADYPVSKGPRGFRKPRRCETYGVMVRGWENRVVEDRKSGGGPEQPLRGVPIVDEKQRGVPTVHEKMLQWLCFMERDSCPSSCGRVPTCFLRFSSTFSFLKNVGTPSYRG